MKRRIGVLIVVLLISCRVNFANADTTKIPSWSVTTDSYSECNEDVRVVVSSEPLKASDITLLISSNYRFMTVIKYNGVFHWYFVRYESCLVDGDLMRYFIIDELLEGDYK